MKYRAIIADDEEKIIRLIRMLGHWSFFDVEIVDECTDGKTALSSILENRPDFVISDIKMPQLDGLQLITEARKNGADCQFILISGYRHFEYARNAVSLNAVDYLLKPVNEEELNETIARTIRMIDETKRLNEEKDEYLLMKERQRTALQKQFWETLIHPEANPAYNEEFRSCEMLNRAYRFTFEDECWQIVFLTGDIYRAENGNDVFDEEICRRFNTFFSPLGAMYFYRNHFGYNIILNFRAEKTAAVREAVMSLFYSIRDLSEIFGDFSLHFGVSGVHNRSIELKDAFREARAAEWGRFSVRLNGVLFWHQIRDMKMCDPSSLITPEQTESVCASLRYLRRDELAPVFDEIAESFQKADQIHPLTVSEAYFRLVDAATQAVAEENRASFSRGIDNAYPVSASYRDLIRNTFLAMDACISHCLESVSEKNRKPIAEAVYYIGLHYSEPVSLSEVAEACGVSSAYLSRLFKEEKGIGFQDYLTGIRIENAEKLLRETNLSVKEIALAVGYPDEKYFSRLYKKQTGIKPSDYRRIYG